jgi:hypothetical protein
MVAISFGLKSVHQVRLQCHAIAVTSNAYRSSWMSDRGRGDIRFGVGSSHREACVSAIGCTFLVLPIFFHIGWKRRLSSHELLQVDIVDGKGRSLDRTRKDAVTYPTVIAPLSLNGFVTGL